MDEKKLNKLLEDIEIFMDSSTRNTDKIIDEFKALKNGSKEAEILNESAKRLNSSIEDFDLKIGLFSDLIRNFNPVVEHRTPMVNVNNPLAWIVSAIGVILISFLICLNFYLKNQQLRQEKEYYQEQAEVRNPNYFKYYYLVNFDTRVNGYLKDFEAQYNKSPGKYQDKVLTRLKQIALQEQIQKDTELKYKEARESQQSLDSINRQINAQ